MRIPLVAGNWKMFMTVAEGRHFVSELVPGLEAISTVERVLCPPFTALMAVRALLEGTSIELGAQDVHWEASGAYTGEVSPLMVLELCSHVIIGHSERRTYFWETDEIVNRKVRAALHHGLIPIVCVGETLMEHETGRTSEVVTRQLKVGLAELGLGAPSLEDEALAQGEGNSLVIAYEPVWAIGTGQPATGEGANEVIAEIIRPTLAEMYGEQLAQQVRVLYGGSVNAGNAAEFFSQPEIDGALVGGASLKVDEFVSIAQAAAR